MEHIPNALNSVSKETCVSHSDTHTQREREY